MTSGPNFRGGRGKWGVVGLALLACAVLATADSAPARYKDAKFKFSFLPPAGWTQDPDQHSPMVAFLGPKEQDFTVNVSVYSESTSLSNLDSLIKVTKKEDAKVKGFVLYEEKRTKLGGQPAHAWRAHLKLAGKPPLELRQVFCLHDKRSFSLTLTMPPGSVKKYDTVFEKLMTSFRWEK